MANSAESLQICLSTAHFTGPTTSWLSCFCSQSGIFSSEDILWLDRWHPITAQMLNFTYLWPQKWLEDLNSMTWMWFYTQLSIFRSSTLKSHSFVSMTNCSLRRKTFSGTGEGQTRAKKTINIGFETVSETETLRCRRQKMLVSVLNR